MVCGRLIVNEIFDSAYLRWIIVFRAKMLNITWGSREKSYKYNLISTLFILFSSLYENLLISICYSRNFLNLSRKTRKLSKFQFSKRYSCKKKKKGEKYAFSIISKKKKYLLKLLNNLYVILKIIRIILLFFLSISLLF